MKRIAFINPDSPAEILKRLKDLHIESIPVPHSELVAEPLSGHPDIQIFLCNKILFCHPDIDRSFLRRIERFLEIIICGSRLSKEYPNDIPYNIAFTGDRAFHNLKHTDPSIKKHLTSEDTELIDVKQGYSKCSTLIIDRSSIITADRSIHEGALENRIESILIEPGSIRLPGYRYGFIGGAAGTTKDRILFTGDFSHHPDYERIVEFIEKKGKEVELLSDRPIIDLGSILTADIE